MCEDSLESLNYSLCEKILICLTTLLMIARLFMAGLCIFPRIIISLSSTTTIPTPTPLFLFTVICSSPEVFAPLSTHTAPTATTTTTPLPPSESRSDCPSPQECRWAIIS